MRPAQAIEKRAAVPGGRGGTGLDPVTFARRPGREQTLRRTVSTLEREAADREPGGADVRLAQQGEQLRMRAGRIGEAGRELCLAEAIDVAPDPLRVDRQNHHTAFEKCRHTYGSQMTGAPGLFGRMLSCGSPPLPYCAQSDGCAVTGCASGSLSSGAGRVSGQYSGTSCRMCARISGWLRRAS